MYNGWTSWVHPWASLGVDITNFNVDYIFSRIKSTHFNGLLNSGPDLLFNILFIVTTQCPQMWVLNIFLHMNLHIYRDVTLSMCHTY